MKVTVVVSLVLHLLLLWLVSRQAETRTSSNVTMSIFERVAAPQEGAPAVDHPSLRTPTPRPPRARRMARVFQVKPPAPETKPVIAPVPTPPEPEADESDDSSEEASTSADVSGGAASEGHGGGVTAGAPDLHRDPEMEANSCTRGLVYPHQVTTLQKEVVVRLRVILDANGKVHDATVIEHAGEAFDDTALHAVRERCHFTAARNRNGKPVPFVITDYRFHFRPADFETTGHFLMP